MPEKPWFPHVECQESGFLPVMWGRGGWLFIIALFGLLGASGVMTLKVNAGEQADIKMEQNIKVLGENQQKMDERQRIQEAQTALTVKQLNKLLEIGGVTERILAPAVEPSELEKLK